ncbi:hypothetical protein [Clostridium paraputrificum]|uniref:hypothetical protein n=1 Tax=Clostridium paraputrificum TaxID=29363 RepID=UPI000C083105|nr:hypothetical protein [Clostridium paraputrificum]
MNRDKALERAIELKEHSKECESVSFLESDSEFFDYVVSLLERTAQEVPVQEQSTREIFSQLQILLVTASSIVRKALENTIND